jgi:hypothetical protein
VSNLLADWGRPGEADVEFEFAGLQGTTPVWVQAAFSWLTAAFYLWWTIGPQCYPDREWASSDPDAPVQRVRSTNV